ncbi:hypothetical protein BH10PLA2_BH10PLA2_03070 [soil metagenome]
MLFQIGLMALLVPAPIGDPAKPVQAKPAPAKKAVTKPELRKELVARMKAEQDARIELMQMNPKNQPITPEMQKEGKWKAALEKTQKIDHDNLAWFKQVVERNGWPGKSMVGPDGAQGAFLIVQHAVSDLEFMARCLDLLQPAYKAGEAEGQWVALLTDRLLIMREMKKQLFGTQLEFRDGKMVPQPIEDEANVDQRRKELGMQPLEQYLKLVNSRSTGKVKVIPK